MSTYDAAATAAGLEQTADAIRFTDPAQAAALDQQAYQMRRMGNLPAYTAPSASPQSLSQAQQTTTTQSDSKEQWNFAAALSSSLLSAGAQIGSAFVAKKIQPENRQVQPLFLQSSRGADSGSSWVLPAVGLAVLGIGAAVFFSRSSGSGGETKRNPSKRKKSTKAKSKKKKSSKSKARARR